MRNFVLSLVACGANLCASAAEAQVFQDPRVFDANRLRPVSTSEGSIDTESGLLPNEGSWDAYLLYNYVHEPFVVLENGEQIASLLTSRHDAHLGFHYVVLPRLQIGIDVPVALSQQRAGETLSEFTALSDVDALGMGDPAITPKIAILQGERAQLALLARTTIPVAFPDDAYMGEEGVSSMPELALTLGKGPFFVHANVGAAFRPAWREPVLNTEVGNELVNRLAARYRFPLVPVSIESSVRSFTPLSNPWADGTANETGSEIHVGARLHLARGLEVMAGGGAPLENGYTVPEYRVFAGARIARRTSDDPEEPSDRDGDGILDMDDGCPDEPEDFDGFKDKDGCPDPDNDKDSILDVDDQCPLEPEDHDTYQDEDGCPDPDNDGDKILDKDDKCPLHPEDFDGFEDEDGCPDPDNDGDGVLDVEDNCPLVPGVPENQGCKKKQLVVIRGCSIDLSQKVYFAVNKDRVLPRSFPLLNNLAQVINGQVQIKKLRIEGHTDSTGSDAYNMSLSQRRADSVTRYLIEQGSVAAERLVATGFGETQPIETNDTPVGRAANRRVQVTMLDCVEETEEVEVDE